MNLLKTRLTSVIRSLPRAVLIMSIMYVGNHTSAQNAEWEGINYQGVARDASGDPITNQLIAFKFSIVQGLADAYVETQVTPTDDRGLFSMIIGNGAYQSGQYDAWEKIDWSTPFNLSLRVDADFTGGTNYQLLSFETIRAVPYASLAKEAIVLRDSAWVTGSNSTVYSGNGYSVGIGTTATDPSAIVDVSSTTQGFLPPRMTSAQRNAIVNPAAGLIVYCTDCGFNGEVQFFGGTAWANMIGEPTAPPLGPFSTQLGADIDGEASFDDSGTSVPLSADGSRVAIGAFLNDGNGQSAGHVRLYDWNGSAWVQVGADIDGEASDDWSGRSVSLSADGSRVAIGAPENNNGNGLSGHVRVYDE